MNAIEIFAGACGLAMGINKAGFIPVLALEKDIDCCNNIFKNQGVKEVSGWSIINKDIIDFSFQDYENRIDLVSGGPPCQPFSFGGRHLADLDARNMFPQAIRTIREIKPKAFIFENVRGLTRQSFSNYLEYIRLQLTFPEVFIRKNETWINHLSRLEDIYSKGTFSGLKYNVLMQILNAADYGIPQKRERVFFVGFKSGIGSNWHFPIPTHSREALIHNQLFGNYWDRHKVPNSERTIINSYKNFSNIKTSKPLTLPWRTVRDAIADLPDPINNPIVKSSMVSNHSLHLGARSYKGHTGSVLDEPAKTLKAGNHGVPGGENMIQYPDGTMRYFTVRESARLQNFPDDYVFHCSWGKAMYQLGNAVPIDLAFLLAKSIKVSLSNCKF